MTKNCFVALFKCISVGVLLSTLISCAATHTAISKRHLNVQTKMSETIFLDPASPEKKIVFVQIRNTSGNQQLNLKPKIAHALTNKGYRVTQNPNEANYWVQANVLQVGKTNLSESNDVLDQGFGGGVTAAAAAGALSGDGRTALGVGLVGATIGVVSNAMVKDINYTLITDLQISERTSARITESLESKLKQGTSGHKTLTSSENTHWKRYQTRVVSTANKVNLDLNEALPELTQGLSSAVAGIM